MGITGSDLVAEAQADVQTRLSLGVGKCRLAVCVPESMEIDSPAQLNGLRIATSFTNVTKTIYNNTMRKHVVPPQVPWKS